MNPLPASLGRQLQFKVDCLFRADIHADATEYALSIFHTPQPDHIAYIEPHGAVFRAFVAVRAAAGIN
jgi:hypothetical protein